jgi:hypothetical protein
VSHLDCRTLYLRRTERTFALRMAPQGYRVTPGSPQGTGLLFTLGIESAETINTKIEFKKIDFVSSQIGLAEARQQRLKHRAEIAV